MGREMQVDLNALLAWMLVFKRRHGFGPSVRDIAAYLKSSTSEATYVLNRLEKQGRIVRMRINERCVPRMIEFVEGD